jgi:hypothetical protein
VKRVGGCAKLTVHVSGEIEHGTNEITDKVPLPLNLKRVAPRVTTGLDPRANPVCLGATWAAEQRWLRRASGMCSVNAQSTGGNG